MSKTKSQVFALAKKHGVTISGDVDRYWGRAKCEWDSPEGYKFADTDNHWQGFDCLVGPDIDGGEGVKDAPMFWTQMYEELKENVDSLTPCTPENGYEECDYCGRKAVTKTKGVRK